MRGRWRPYLRDRCEVDEKRKPAENVKGLEYGLNLPKHMTEHIYMFTGQSASVQLRFKKSFLNLLYLNRTYKDTIPASWSKIHKTPMSICNKIDMQN